MAKAKKLPSGSWRVLKYVGLDKNGKRRYLSFTASTKQEAEYMAASYAMENEDVTEANLTVSQAMQKYINIKEQILSPSTILSYTLYSKALPSIAKIPINKLSNDKVQEAINIYSATHSPGSVRNAYILLTSTLRMFAPNKHLNVTLPTPKKPNTNIPTKEQLQLLLENCQGTKLYTCILLASGVGLRRSEISALTWNDYDADKKTLTINKAKVQDKDYNWQVKGTKTLSSTRTLVLPNYIVQHLNSLERTSYEIIGYSPNTITDSFVDLRDKLGFNFRFHDLRHFYASVLLALGVPDKYAMQRMGHSSTKMLKNVYQHIMRDKQAEIEQNINAKLDSFFS